MSNKGIILLAFVTGMALALISFVVTNRTTLINNGIGRNDNCPQVVTRDTTVLRGYPRPYYQFQDECNNPNTGVTYKDYSILNFLLDTFSSGLFLLIFLFLGKAITGSEHE
jgi:hypothetical protein